MKSGSKNPNAKLMNEQVKFIRENFKPRDKPFGATALAKKFNVSTSTIRNVINFKSYKNEK